MALENRGQTPISQADYPNWENARKQGEIGGCPLFPYFLSSVSKKKIVVNNTIWYI